jgi:hypothetical protein
MAQQLKALAMSPNDEHLALQRCKRAEQFKIETEGKKLVDLITQCLVQV